MTTQEKQMITSLSENGLGYRKIAAQIGISENTVKSYLKRMTAAEDQKEPDQPAAVFHARNAARRSASSRDEKQSGFALTRAGINGGILIRIISGVNRSGYPGALSAEKPSLPIAAVTGNTAPMIVSSVTGSEVSNDGTDKAGVSE